MECHEPSNLPIAPLGIDEPTMQVGLRRSIYTDEQMKEFYAFQNAAGARNAFLADQTERAKPEVEEIGASLWAIGPKT